VYIARSTTSAAGPLALSMMVAKRRPVESGNVEATRIVLRLWAGMASSVVLVPPSS
jgi:hypothetical protein